VPGKTHRALAAFLAGMTMPAGLIAGAAAADAASAAPASTVPGVEQCGAGAALVRPVSVILTCADHGELATSLRWSRWSAAGAAATGKVAWRGCSDCADSTPWRSTGAKLTLTAPVTEPGGQVLFTRLRLQVTGPAPGGFKRDLTFSEAPPSAVVPQDRARPRKTAPRRPVISPPASGVLGYAAIEGYWIEAGGPASVAGTAAAITGAESSFLPGNIEEGYPYAETGWGLWQIDPGSSVPADGSDFQLLDPWNNAEAAVTKYDRDIAAGEPGFEAWTTWTTGNPRPYERYVQNVRPDAALTDPGQYLQYDRTPSGTPAAPAASPGSQYGPAMPAMLTGTAGSSGRGELMNYASELCLEVTAGKTIGYAVQAACAASAGQTWHWGGEDGSTGGYQLVNGDGDCLGITYGRITEGARAVVWTCDGNADQYWRPLTGSVPPGYLYLENLKSGDALGVSGGSTAAGAAVVQRSWQDILNNQLWS
jgi:hypothetical protein